MTPSELSAIRVECALARGWTHLTQFTNRITDPSGNAIFFDPLETAKIEHLPNYPEDANAALSLATALANGGWEMQCFMNAKGVCVRFRCDEHGLIEATAPTFALALCLAFLKIHRSKKD